MEAARLKRARRRMLGYFLGSGVALAALYLILAAFVIRLIGLELTQYAATLMLAVGVMLGGIYGVVMLVWLILHVARRWSNRQPIMDLED